MENFPIHLTNRKQFNIHYVTKRRTSKSAVMSFFLFFNNTETGQPDFIRLNSHIIRAKIGYRVRYDDSVRIGNIGYNRAHYVAESICEKLQLPSGSVKAVEL